MVLYLNYGDGGGVLLCGDGSEDFLNLCLCALNVHVSDHYHSLISGMIPCVVELYQALGLEGLKMLLSADKGVKGRLGAFSEIVGERALHCAPAGVTAGAAFLDYDSAFRVNLRGFIEHIV